jgi:hypothetical protein
MPILPGLCDSDENLSNVIRQTAGHGGQFVIASGLTLADKQRTYFFDILQSRFHDLMNLYERLYPIGSYAAREDQWSRLGKRVRELCDQNGIKDRVPRPIIPGDKRAFNKRLVEEMADRSYSLELSDAPAGRVWDWRKAAWAVEDLEQDIRLVHSAMGRKGIRSMDGVSENTVDEIVQMITSRSAT